MITTKPEALVIWQRLKRDLQPLTPKRRNGIIARLKLQKHKAGVDKNDWDLVRPNLLLIAEFDLNFCEAMGLPVEYTSIIRPMISVSTTDIHAKKRAYDRTLRAWPVGIAAWFAELVNDGLSVGAVSRSDGKEREAVFETDMFDKNGKQIKWKHLHFQCKA